MALDNLPALERWTTQITLLVDDVPQHGGSFTAQYRGPRDMTLGPCTYQTWWVRTALEMDGREPIIQDRFYAPSLGLSLGTVTVDAQGNPLRGVVYDRIEAR